MRVVVDVIMEAAVCVSKWRRRDCSNRGSTGRSSGSSSICPCRSVGRAECSRGSSRCRTLRCSRGSRRRSSIYGRRSSPSCSGYRVSSSSSSSSSSSRRSSTSRVFSSRISSRSRSSCCSIRRSIIAVLVVVLVM
eukprot:2909506-Pyramimonas_sp.AAC.1